MENALSVGTDAGVGGRRHYVDEGATGDSGENLNIGGSGSSTRTIRGYIGNGDVRADDVIFVFSVGGGNAEKNISANIVEGLKTAKAGGESYLASSMSVYNEVLKRRPDLVPALFEPPSRVAP